MLIVASYRAYSTTRLRSVSCAFLAKAVLFYQIRENLQQIFQFRAAVPGTGVNL